jgi:hypothetical protein
MGRAEFHVEGYLVDRVKAAGGMCLKFSSAISGVPDRIVILAGRTLFVETKALDGSLSKIQKVQIRRMRAAGGDVRVINNRDLVNDLISELTAVDVHEAQAS